MEIVFLNVLIEICTNVQVIFSEMFLMKLTSKEANYRCLPHNLVKCSSHRHRGFRLGNHNKSTFDLKGCRIVKNTLYIDRRWKQQSCKRWKNLGLT
jgi:hypothetical protein